MSDHRPEPREDFWKKDLDQGTRTWSWPIVGLAVLLLAIVLGLAYTGYRHRLQVGEPDVVGQPIAPARKTPELTRNQVPDSTTASRDKTAANPALPIAASDFLAAPDQQVGKIVQMTGTIDEIIGPNAFMLKASSSAPSDRYLVIVPQIDATSSPLSSFETGDSITLTAAITAFDTTKAKEMAAAADPTAIDNYANSVVLIGNSLAH